MNINLNGQATQFDGQTLADLINTHTPAQPFAVAVNTEFVPKPRYAEHKLQEGDLIDIVRRVVGG